tara:strand:+ start:1001 stop:1258 length:258 start_codon:yes stop_codon:yes gene_type:complete
MNEDFYESGTDGPFSPFSANLDVRFALEKDEGEKTKEKERLEKALSSGELMTESDSDLILPRYAKRDRNKPKEELHPPNDISSTT